MAKVRADAASDESTLRNQVQEHTVYAAKSSWKRERNESKWWPTRLHHPQSTSSRIQSTPYTVYIVSYTVYIVASTVYIAVYACGLGQRLASAIQFSRKCLVSVSTQASIWKSLR
eukprot:2501069-Rhodomonas_salina.1